MLHIWMGWAQGSAPGVQLEETESPEEQGGEEAVEGGS